MMMPTRKIVWVPSTEDKYLPLIASLETRLAKFYSNTPGYYSDINFTSGYWTNQDELGFCDIVKTAKRCEKTLEIGCGAGNILKYHEDLRPKYCGCDFSVELLSKNSKKYPLASFVPIVQPNLLPFANETFDFVFSVFVLEHSTNPSLLLDESVRVLKKDGILIILCPDFLGRGRMTSQRAGFSEGTSKNKFKQKKYLDALVSLFDNRIRIPAYSKYLSFKCLSAPKFFINLYPTVFLDKFIPDVDAVYVTCKDEIINFIKKSLGHVENSSALKRYEYRRKLIYLKFKKE